MKYLKLKMLIAPMLIAFAQTGTSVFKPDSISFSGTLTPQSLGVSVFSFQCNILTERIRISSYSRNVIKVCLNFTENYCEEEMINHL